MTRDVSECRFSATFPRPEAPRTLSLPGLKADLRAAASAIRAVPSAAAMRTDRSAKGPGSPATIRSGCWGVVAGWGPCRSSGTVRNLADLV